MAKDVRNKVTAKSDSFPTPNENSDIEYYSSPLQYTTSRLLCISWSERNTFIYNAIWFL